MGQQATLARKKDPAERGFEILKQEGVRLAQQYSGEIWTDYNLHDPGVTILDQLCYALTDLVYRAGFPVADFLAGKDGSIDLAALGLHPPQEILPARPATVADLRKHLFGEIPEIDDLWIDELQHGARRGLYRVAVRLDDDVPAEAAERVPAAIRRAFCRCRNLCEDLDEVTVIPEQSCELHARIDLAEHCDPAEVTALVYHLCAMKIAAGIRFYPLEEALRQGCSLEEILTGPFTKYGVTSDAELAASRDSVRIADLFSIVRRIEGVAQVHELYLQADGEKFYDHLASGAGQTAFRLRFPDSEEEAGVALKRNGRDLSLSWRRVKAKYDELHFRHHAMRRVPHDLSALWSEPVGSWRDFSEYFSIQNDFPAIYGVNMMGLPLSAPVELKGKVAQLKGYLLLFEQLLANYNADLARLGKLFSPQSTARHTYSYQMVENDGTPPLRELYREGAREAIAAFVAEHDRFEERRNRLLDYLLALYGEKFPSDPFRHFDLYHLDDQGEQRLIEAKVSLLRSIVEAGRDRGAGLDYLEPAETGKVSGVQLRVSLFLGWQPAERSLTAPMGREQMKLVRHEEILHSLELYFRHDEHRGGEPPLVWERVPLAPPRMTADPALMRGELAGIRVTSRGILPHLLMQGGIDLGNYRVLLEPGRAKLLFTPDGGLSWWQLADYPGAIHAFRGANLLCRFLCDLSREMEGMHVVEHILLRPAAEESAEREDPFYCFRVSVLFPAWTARGADAAFRELAEDLVLQNSPAHIFPEFHWLDFDAMAQFERLYFDWRALASATVQGAPERERAAVRLVQFLRKEAKP